MASGSHATAGANRLHGKELQPTILAEQARLTDRKSDRPLRSVKTTCPQTGQATVPWNRSAESTNRRSDQVSSSRPTAKVYQQVRFSVPQLLPGSRECGNSGGVPRCSGI